MAHWRKNFSGPDLESADLPNDGKGKAMITITAIGGKELEDGAGKKGLITFTPSPNFATKKTTWLAAVTVGHQLAKMFGLDDSNWIGKRVVIFAATVSGEPALRVYGSPDITSECEVKVREFGGGRRLWKMVPIKLPTAGDSAAAAAGAP